MKPNNLLLLLGAGFAAWYFFLRKPGRAGEITYLKAWLLTTPSPSQEDIDKFNQVLAQMSDAEVDTVYEYIHDYVTKGKNLVQGSDLFNRLMLVSNKYQIFT